MGGQRLGKGGNDCDFLMFLEYKVEESCISTTGMLSVGIAVVVARYTATPRPVVRGQMSRTSATPKFHRESEILYSLFCLQVRELSPVERSPPPSNSINSNAAHQITTHIPVISSLRAVLRLVVMGNAELSNDWIRA
jgi:hypothetical protein